MAHNLKFLLVLILVNFSGSDDPKSNILRLSRPKSTTLRSTSDLKVDDKSDNEKTEVLRDRLLAFSKNNPESDWKTYLKIVNDKNETDGVSDLDLEFSKDKFELNANSIQWLNDIYDPLRWHRIPGKLTPQCLRDMELFITSLKDGKLWAAKS